MPLWWGERPVVMCSSREFHCGKAILYKSSFLLTMWGRYHENAKIENRDLDTSAVFKINEGFCLLKKKVLEMMWVCNASPEENASRTGWPFVVRFRQEIHRNSIILLCPFSLKKKKKHPSSMTLWLHRGAFWLLLFFPLCWMKLCNCKSCLWVAFNRNKVCN